MAVIKLFSKRQKELRGELPDVYVYDDLSRALRIQIIHIWYDALGRGDEDGDNVIEIYKFIVDTLCREHGFFILPGSRGYGGRNYIEELRNFFLEEKNVGHALDAVELSFRGINVVTRKFDYLYRHDANERADSAIEELNLRFKEHGVGFQFVDREIIRIDSELIHSEVVKPALRLLNKMEYAGAQQEFLKAHEHYRSGDAKEALNECLKAFESLMKSICEKRGWSYNSNATAKSLIQVCLDNKLVPEFWQSNFTSLRSLLESSVPTGRNKMGGHGQGPKTITVPNHLVAYMLHMTASTLVFLGEAEAALP